MKILNQKGISIYLAMAIIAILLTSALGVSVIFVSQIRILAEMGNSVVAFYAADSGVEKVLTQRDNPVPLDGYSETISNDASFLLSVSSAGVGGCSAVNYCIRSIGNYKETNRGIEITY